MPWPKGKKYSVEHVAKRTASFMAAGSKRRRPQTIDGVEHWRCGTCRAFKPRAAFYEDGKCAVGPSSVCRKCHTATTMRTRDKEAARASNAAYMRRARTKNPDLFRERERRASRTRKVTPKRIAARRLLNAAVRHGFIVKPKVCSECKQARRITGHHEDYSKPLVVVWLCYPCHGKRHRVVEFKRVTA